MPDPTPGGPTPTPNEEPGAGALFQILVTGDRDPTAIYTAIREVESMAGRSVATQMSSEIAQLSSQIKTVADRLEARLDSVETRFDSIDTRFDSIDTRFDSIDRHFRLIWSFLFTLLAMLVALLLRT